MSDNLSIEEIIKRAEEIRSRAEEQLASAEKKLDEQAKSAIDEIVVDEKSVVEKITTLLEEEEDIKEFVPSKSQKVPAVRIEAEGDDEEIKIAPDFSKNKDKTRTVTFGGEDDIKIAKPEKTDNKTKTMAFVSKPKVDKESDLQEMPTIVARENIYDGFDVSANPTPFIEDTGEQITFEGFDDKIEVVPTIDEDVAEQILEERRREKVVKFRLFGPDETDLKLGNSEEVKEEYNSKSETDDFLQNLLASSKAQKTRSFLSAAVLALLLLLTVSKDSAYLPSLLANHTAYFIVALIIYIAAIGINIKSFIHGFKIKKHINFDFAISALNVAILVHTAALLINNSLWIDNGTLLASFGAFSLTMSSLGKSKMLKRAIDNFKFITSSREKYTVENITNNIDAEKICRGLVSEEPIIKTSVKTDFPTNFLEISYKNEPANKVAGTVLPIALLLNIILFVAVGIIDNFNSAFNMLLCGLSVSLPCCSLFLTNSTLCDVSNALRDYGSRVCGYEGAAMAYNANTMVMEAADLFSKNSCEMHGIKTFDNAKVDDAILQAAAVMIQTKSPVAHVFDDVIIGKQSILPKVEKISYEDKMGTSAWIYNKKILVGNRAMLKNHGVSVPSESFEKKHSIRGRKVLYLSVDGKLTAMFVFSYSANPDLKRELKKLEKSGITIIVKSTDPHINEKSIAKLFNLPEGFIRVMNSSSAMVYEKYSNMHVEKSPAYVVHNGSALGFVSAMRAAEIIVSQRKLIKFLCFFGSALGFAAIALLSLLGAYSQISAVSIILFHLIWNLFVLMISKLRGISL
ncbi:MAG: hypothetical protein IJ927_01810 [Eubacterium sp.]|nr:hypothetical protein [Eubacterium sp.]